MSAKKEGRDLFLSAACRREYVSSHIECKKKLAFGPSELQPTLGGGGANNMSFTSHTSGQKVVPLVGGERRRKRLKEGKRRGERQIQLKPN